MEIAQLDISKAQAILERLKDNAIFSAVGRESLPYDMETVLSIVDFIGKKRDAKFVLDESNIFLYTNLIKWVYGDPSVQCLDPETKQVIPGRLTAGIYIAGNTGSGKSWALEIMSAVAQLERIGITVSNERRALKWPCVRTDAVCDEYSKDGEIRKYKDMTVVCFQDLGTEPLESLFMGNRQGVMKQILEHRGDLHNVITLISSNLPINHKALNDRYDDRVSSRLCEMCNYFELKGQDRRKLK